MCKFDPDLSKEWKSVDWEISIFCIFGPQQAQNS